ncbi:hypothetical protein [Kaistia sp. UC242_56]|uniref:hypothetical protein n=1 Tax=Kaistia sp. UC242_56 TaxID=3374625 RepID=UPI0037BA347C
MVKHKHTPGPWEFRDGAILVDGEYLPVIGVQIPMTVGERRLKAIANARLIAAAPDLLNALQEGRRAIGDHSAPYDCYATGPVTGDAYRDLVQCPACSFIALYDAAIAKATGEAA